MAGGPKRVPRPAGRRKRLPHPAASRAAEQRPPTAAKARRWPRRRPRSRIERGSVRIGDSFIGTPVRKTGQFRPVWLDALIDNERVRWRRTEKADQKWPAYLSSHVKQGLPP